MGAVIRKVVFEGDSTVVACIWNGKPEKEQFVKGTPRVYGE